MKSVNKSLIPILDLQKIIDNNHVGEIISNRNVNNKGVSKNGGLLK